jgi:hypothetical protein
MLPVGTKVLTTVLKVGSYERPIVIEGDPWRDVAKKVVSSIDGARAICQSRRFQPNCRYKEGGVPFI